MPRAVRRWLLTPEQCTAQEPPHRLRRVLVTRDGSVLRCELCGAVIEEKPRV